MNNNKVTLGYWRIRGRGQIPRLLLAYTGATWQDVQYTAPEQWFANDKHGLHLDFPNLPYLIEGDFKVTQASAIISYIIERSKRTELLGNNIKEKAIILNLAGVITQCMDKLSAIAFSPNGTSLLQKTWKQTIFPKLSNLQAFKGHKRWLMGYLSLADFVFVEMSYYLENIYKEQYKKLRFIQDLRQQFLNVPEIKLYYEQEWSIKGPFLPPTMAVIKF